MGLGENYVLQLLTSQTIQNTMNGWVVWFCQPMTMITEPGGRRPRLGVKPGSWTLLRSQPGDTSHSATLADICTTFSPYTHFNSYDSFCIERTHHEQRWGSHKICLGLGFADTAPAMWPLTLCSVVAACRILYIDTAYGKVRLCDAAYPHCQCVGSCFGHHQFIFHDSSILRVRWCGLDILALFIDP